MNHPFKAENDREKVIYEVSEVLAFSYKNFNGFDIKFEKLYERVKNIKESFVDSIITQPIVIEENNEIINGIEYNKKVIGYPCLKYKCNDDLSIEIIIKDRQYATGVQPMLYVIMRVPECICNRTINANEVYSYIITESNADAFLEIMFHLATLTAGHKRDVIKIMDVIREIYN